MGSSVETGWTTGVHLTHPFWVIQGLLFWVTLWPATASFFDCCHLSWAPTGERNLLTYRFELQRKRPKCRDRKKHAPQSPTYTSIVLLRVQGKGGRECFQSRGEVLKNQRTRVWVKPESPKHAGNEAPSGKFSDSMAGVGMLEVRLPPQSGSIVFPCPVCLDCHYFLCCLCATSSPEMRGSL